MSLEIIQAEASPYGWKLSGEGKKTGRRNVVTVVEEVRRREGDIEEWRDGGTYYNKRPA